MDWAILIFLVVTGLTAAPLWWWCASEVEKAGREGTPAGGNDTRPAVNATRQ